MIVFRAAKVFIGIPKKGYIDDKALINVDIIINLAGATISNRWTQNYKNVILDSRVDSLNTLYNTLQSSKHQVKQIVSASAIGVYPNSLTKNIQRIIRKLEGIFWQMLSLNGKTQLVNLMRLV